MSISLLKTNNMVLDHQDWSALRPTVECCAPFYGTFDYSPQPDGSLVVCINTIVYGKVHVDHHNELCFKYTHSHR